MNDCFKNFTYEPVVSHIILIDTKHFDAKIK